MSTLYPAVRSVPILNAPRRPAASTLVSPPEPHPGPIRIVGAGVSAAADGRGNQWARMIVPSNDGMSKSLVTPATGWALTGSAAGRVHPGRWAAVPAVEDSVGEVDAEGAVPAVVPAALPDVLADVLADVLLPDELHAVGTNAATASSATAMRLPVPAPVPLVVPVLAMVRRRRWIRGVLMAPKYQGRIPGGSPDPPQLRAC